MNTQAAQRYLARFRKVLAYIDAHLDEELGAEELAAVAAYSKFHLHRQFTELFGMGVRSYVQLARLKRASYQLAFRADSRIVDIALGSGYEGPEAFARAFKKSVGQTPSGFRAEPQWQPWYTVQQPLSDLRTTQMTPQFEATQVSIIDFPATPVVAAQHRGDPRQIGDTVRRLIAWRKEHRLPPRVAATFNILYDDPDTTPAEAFRFDVCVATGIDPEPGAPGLVKQLIEGGRCAVLRHVGPDEHLGSAVRYLYGEWLPTSGEEPRDYPLFVRRVSFFPDVPEHEAVTDIHLPLK